MPNPITLPAFYVDHKHAEMIYSNGGHAICDNTNALYALAEMVDNLDDDYKNEVASGFFMGLAHIIRLIGDDLSHNAYGAIVPLNSANVQDMLDLQAKEAKA